MTLPFTFHWVDANQTTFNPSTMNTFDEEILSFELKHDEGQIPTLDIKIRNPRVGLLSPNRKLWAWLAWQSPADDPVYAGALVPLFFGVLVGVPTNMFLEVVTLRLLARSQQFIANKQAVAETMKVAPYYDPIWFDIAHRDDPDSILEGWSSLWHVDRLTHAVTASDILVGEDGTVTFDEDTAFYNSVGLSLSEPPLVNLRIEATVTWTQRSSGFFEVPTVFMTSYTGESFLSDWPKAGTSIGGGYRVESSFVVDTFKVGVTPQTQYSYNWTNTDKNIGQCSNQSASQSSSGPALLSPNALTCVLTGEFTNGVCDPFSDPPTNVPMSYTVTGMIVPLWHFSASMRLRYDAQRQYSEVVVFDMIANVQGILASPLVSQDTELVTISSVDLGRPLQNVKAWTTVAGQSVSAAQIIFPNNPTTPGGLSYQICVTPGVAGVVEPVFSDFSGIITNDGTVQWASLGESPLTDVPAWNSAAFVPVGQIVSLQNVVFNPAIGDYETIPDATTYMICTRGGRTNSVYRTFSYVPPVSNNNDGTPAPRIITVIDPPTFSQTPGALISDGNVTWRVLGKDPEALRIPIGGTPDNVQANNFFPTPRGRAALEFLISKARARLRLRSRAVKVTWKAPFRTGVGLSCRKNATLFDPRLPGSAATGKITGYTLSASDGRMETSVEIGCAVGFGDSITEITGTPVYATPGYMQHGYQQYVGAMVAHGSGDVTYSPPVFTPFDDGLSFPLSFRDISDGGLISGDLASQKAAIEASFKAMRQLQYVQRWDRKDKIVGPQGETTSQSSLTADMAWKLEREQLALASLTTPYVMGSNGISWNCLIKPCSGIGPFEGAYFVEVSQLVVPQGINLEAPSSP